MESEERATEPRGPITAPRLVRLGSRLRRAGTLRPESDVARRALHASMVVLVLSGIALAVVAQTAGLDTPRPVSISSPWLLAAIAGFAALELMHAALWRLICRFMGHPISPMRSRAIWLTSVLARYVPTGAMMFVLRGALSQRAGMSLRVSYASTLYEIAITFAAAATVGAYLVFTLSEFDSIAVRLLVVATALIAIMCIHPSLFGRISDAALKRLGRPPLPQVLHTRQVFGLLSAYCFVFLLGGLFFLALAESMYEVPADEAAVLVAAFPLGTLASILGSVVPGGLGARELGLVAALATVMPASEALVLAIALRLVQIAIELVLAGLANVLALRANAES